MKNIVFIFLSVIFAQDALSSEKIAFAIRDIETGQIIEKQNEKDQMILASVSKLFTSYYVLKNLDGDYRYQTNLFYDGKNLSLKGSGDPYLTTQDLISLIYQLKRKKLDKVEGNFILDDSHLKFTPRISNLGMRDQADNPSIGALNVEFNRISLYRGKNQFFPPLSSIQLKLRPGTQFGQRFKLIDEKDEIWEGFKQEMKKRREEIPTLDSTMFAGHYFRYLAGIHGIILPVPKRGETLKRARLVASHEGLPLWRLVSLGLEYSNNLIAETLLKTAVLEKTGKKLTEGESAQVLKNWLDKNIQSRHLSEYSLENGSGITLKNTASAQLMTDFLRDIYLKNDLKKPFMSYLSINGNSGGLQKLVLDPKHALKIYGKTGSLFYVNNLAGYILGKNGKAYSYAIFMTDSRREKLNHKMNKAQEKLKRDSKGWYRSSNKLIEDFLLNWIQKL